MNCVNEFPSGIGTRPSKMIEKALSFKKQKGAESHAGFASFSVETFDRKLLTLWWRWWPVNTICIAVLLA
jgi:hypothetical protein